MSATKSSTAKVPHLTIDQRMARGKAARAEVPRSSHAAFEPSDDRADPLANQRAVLRLFRRLHKRGFNSLLLDSNGRGGYHLIVIFDAPLPSAGALVIDFNKAYNPPCAFTRFATCPLPPKGNRLEVRVAAGEKDYGHH